MTLTFQHPILVRGYGIKSANDSIECSPKNWHINVRNYLKEEVQQDGSMDKTKPKFFKVAELTNAKFINPNELQKFNLKPKLVSAVMLEVIANDGGKDLKIGEFKLYC